MGHQYVVSFLWENILALANKHYFSVIKHNDKPKIKAIDSFALQIMLIVVFVHVGLAFFVDHEASPGMMHLNQYIAISGKHNNNEPSLCI